MELVNRQEALLEVRGRFAGINRSDRRWEGTLLIAPNSFFQFEKLKVKKYFKEIGRFVMVNIPLFCKKTYNLSVGA